MKTTAPHRTHQAIDDLCDPQQVFSDSSPKVQLAEAVVNAATDCHAQFFSENALHDSSAAPARFESATVLVHSHLRWDFVWQRPQQIFSRLAAHHPVLFLEEPLWNDDCSQLQISQPLPNIMRLVPRLSADLKTATIDEQCTVVLSLFRTAQKQHRLLSLEKGSVVQWFYSPMTAPCFLGQFGAASVVYDCMDELANFRFAPPDITQRENFLLSNTDVVFTGGYQLFEAKSKNHSNAHFYGCGVDTAHYATARSPHTPVPAQVAGLPKPVLGYFGVIDERIDYELIARLAESFSSGSIVMVGPLAKVDADQLPKHDNLHWLGQRSYDDLPALVKSFDVCLMPFALNETTRYINPTKTLEYMAAGKPIVSTAVADVVRNFTPLVAVGNSHEEFIAAARRAAENLDQALIARGIARAETSSWDAVVEAMRGHMLDSLLAVCSAKRHSDHVAVTEKRRN
jgi:glycosyltransferase involved in cell wall biosynthesis